ncbi:MAG TPA: HNH endonuclease [Longimicrobiales bacterium]|nr:HNH endonuclease [Longimicrobiales bacterium]
MSTLDDEVRAAIFARAQQLRDRFGSRIPRAELMRHVQVRGHDVPIFNYQKGIFKPAALGREAAAVTIQTSADSPYDDVLDPDAARFVYRYRGTDPRHPDNVALRRARDRQLPLLYLVAVDPGFYDAIFPVFVVGDDPDELAFLLAADPLGYHAGADDPAAHEALREYVTRAVMQRLHQTHFRRRVLTAYRGQCAICRLKHLELLDAAHILPDRHPRGAPLVSNGLGLCKIHHSAYDSNIVGIDPDARVHVRSDILDEVDGPMLRHGLQELHGSRLVLPRQLADRPNRDFLAERFEAFRAA